MTDTPEMTQEQIDAVITRTILATAKVMDEMSIRDAVLADVAGLLLDNSKSRKQRVDEACEILRNWQESKAGP